MRGNPWDARSRQIKRYRPLADVQPENADSQLEVLKRRRELALVVSLAFAFCLLSWIEIRLLGVSQKLPFVHSVFFFGLVNFNIVILLSLFFFIFRNLVKVFVEKRGRVVGSSLKSKLVAAFVAFSSVPTLLMFLVSVFYINSSFDKWFSVKMAGVLRGSLEVTNEYYVAAKKRNYHFAQQIAKDLARQNPTGSALRWAQFLDQAVREYRLDGVEYYPDLYSNPVSAVDTSHSVPDLPPATNEFLAKGVRARAEDSTIQSSPAGNWVRVIVPVPEPRSGAIVVSSFTPLSLVSQMADISAAYEDFRDVNPLEYPLKSIYLVILILMTLVILLCATWFGFHLARQLAIPLETLGLATRRVVAGDYQPVDVRSGSQEMNVLVASFNVMTQALADSQRDLKTAMGKLHDRNRHMEVILSQASTGVISTDTEDRITTINRYAAEMLKVDTNQMIGESVAKVLGEDWVRASKDMLKAMRKYKKTTLQKEFRLQVRDQTLPLQMSLSLLQDESGRDMGRVLVFDDLTTLVSAQRAAAWREVARRIAHEIKNPLTPIKLSAQRLQKKFGGQIADPAFRDCTEMIIRQADEMKDLVNEFSQFARLPQSRPVAGSLHQVIEESLVLYRNSHPRIHFMSDLAGDVPVFSFDPEQIRRVLTNLIDNAVAALADAVGGSVAIATHYDNVLRIVRMTVSDNGPGVDSTQRDRIFDPYFSTKEDGTGLGLSIVKRIIEDHSGFIRAVQNVPRGLRMVVELPVVGDKIVPVSGEGASESSAPMEVPT